MMQERYATIEMCLYGDYMHRIRELFRTDLPPYLYWLFCYWPTVANVLVALKRPIIRLVAYRIILRHL